MPPRPTTFPNPAYPPPSDVAPHLKAHPALRAFREESQLSWRSLNRIWMDISHILNSPAFDILLDASRSHEAKYRDQLAELTRDVLASGVFGPETQGTWRYGRHDEEEDKDAIVDFIARLTVYAAKGIMGQVTPCDDPCEIKEDKVGAWLMNEEATVWDEYEFVSRDAEQLVSNEDYCYYGYGTGAAETVNPGSK